MTYDRVHKYFLRTIMSKGVLSESECRRVLQRCSDEHHELSEIISEINKRIRPFSQDIKKVKHEITGEHNIVFVWNGLGEAALSQNLYSQQEVLYWRKLLEEIAVSDRKRIGAIEALNICSGVTSITKTRAQDLMDEWTSAKYLERIEDGNYVLGIRGIHEFEPYLRLNLPDSIDVCTLCTKSVFQSRQCDHCGKFFHKFCLLTAKGKMKTWPCCKNVYREEESMQEDDVDLTTERPKHPDRAETTADCSDEEMMASQEY